MKVMVLAAVAALVLAGAAAFVLNGEQRPAYEAFVGSGAQLRGDPGNNLVGPDWDGLNRPARQG